MKALAVLALFPLAGCMGTPVVTATPLPCTELIPPDWKDGVAGAELPNGDTVGDWVSFADATVGKLDQANSRTRDVIHICTKVEQNNAKAIRQGTRGWFARLFS